MARAATKIPDYFDELTRLAEWNRDQLAVQLACAEALYQATWLAAFLERSSAKFLGRWRQPDAALEQLRATVDRRPDGAQIAEPFVGALLQAMRHERRDGADEQNATPPRLPVLQDT